jgi:hypothetical protein
MIDDGRAENAKNDWERLFETCRENECKQLGLVANFSERYYAC